MNQRFIIANSIAWAAAILASATLGAPTTLTLILLPALAAASWLASLAPATSRRGCR